MVSYSHAPKQNLPFHGPRTLGRQHRLSLPLAKEYANNPRDGHENGDAQAHGQTNGKLPLVVHALGTKCTLRLEKMLCSAGIDGELGGAVGVVHIVLGGGPLGLRDGDPVVDLGCLALQMLNADVVVGNLLRQVAELELKGCLAIGEVCW